MKRPGIDSPWMLTLYNSPLSPAKDTSLIPISRSISLDNEQGSVDTACSDGKEIDFFLEGAIKTIQV
jgi:hypothetical protein